jgi:hypothetical protein
MWPTWVKMVLGPFAETKGPRLPGRNPATQKITLIRELGDTRAIRSPASVFFTGKPQDGFPIHIVKL